MDAITTLPNTPHSAVPTDAASEEQIAHVLDLVCRHPRHRELYYKVLAFAQGTCELEAAEDFLEAQVEYAGALQESCTLVNVLIENGGLEYAEYDQAGQLMDEAYVERALEGGATEDDVYASVHARTVTTTPPGVAVVELLQPERRIAAFATSVPERTPAYRQLLEFCACAPRMLDEINALFAGNPLLEPTARTAGQKLHASYFIDRMNEAGGLEWRHGWVTTEAGKSFLAGSDNR